MGDCLMLTTLYMLFMAFGMFLLSFCGLMIALSMWQKSKTICDECKDKIDA